MSDSRVSVCVAVADGFTGHALVKEFLRGSLQHRFSSVGAAYIVLDRRADNSDELEPAFEPAPDATETPDLLAAGDETLLPPSEWRKAAKTVRRLGAKVCEIGMPASLATDPGRFPDFAEPFACQTLFSGTNAGDSAATSAAATAAPSPSPTSVGGSPWPAAPTTNGVDSVPFSSLNALSPMPAAAPPPGPPADAAAGEKTDDRHGRHSRRPSVFDVRVSTDDPFRARLVALFRQYDSVCIVPPAIEQKLYFTNAVIDACRDANVKNVLLVTCLHSGCASMTYAPHLFQFHDMEDYLKRSGIAHHCILRPSLYQEALLLWLPQMRAKGRLALPLAPDARFAPVHLGDVARLAAHILAAPPPYTPYMAPAHRSSVYAVTGPASYDASEIARLFADALGRPVEFCSNSANETRRYLERQASRPLADNDVSAADKVFLADAAASQLTLAAAVTSDDAVAPPRAGKSISSSEVRVLLELLDETARGQLSELHLVAQQLLGQPLVDLPAFLSSSVATGVSDGSFEPFRVPERSVVA